MEPWSTRWRAGWAMQTLVTWASWPASWREFFAPCAGMQMLWSTSYHATMWSTHHWLWAGTWAPGSWSSRRSYIARRERLILWISPSSARSSTIVWSGIRRTVLFGNRWRNCATDGVTICSSICFICCQLWSLSYQRSYSESECPSTRKYCKKLDLLNF